VHSSAGTSPLCGRHKIRTTSAGTSPLAGNRKIRTTSGSSDEGMISRGASVQTCSGETSRVEIDNLIVELQMQREKLLSESARVQRDIVEFARLSQSTMQSTKIIAESLVYWN
jgi:hypothetical protein